jgi:ribose 5-phosphate isomerase B
MNVAIGSDHAGFPLKQFLVGFLREHQHNVIDVGTDSADVAVDYSDFAEAVAQHVLNGTAERGIIVCGSGVGASIAANKIPGIYAALVHDTYSAHQGVEHDNMNVICFGSRVIGTALAQELAVAYLGATFESHEERHVRRHGKVKAIEQRGIARHGTE